MKLDKHVIDMFTELTKPADDVIMEKTCYGTISVVDGTRYVKLDGSDLLVPAASTVKTSHGDRVTVLMKNHSLTVTGNLTAPATDGEGGSSGEAGTAATIEVGTVTTGEAGSSASVTNSGTTSAAIFDFVIPRGDKGEKGDTGPQGPQGEAGTAATIKVGRVTTVEGAILASVTNSGTTSAAVFDFVIPRGEKGEKGEKGDTGTWDGTIPDHEHTVSDITDFPTSLPANGGNADTLDGKHASDFSQIINLGHTSTDTKNALGIRYQTTAYWCFNWTDYPAGMYDGQGMIIAAHYNSYGTTVGVDSIWCRQIFISPHPNTKIYQRIIANTDVGEWTSISDGGNADTVDGKHASDLAYLTNVIGGLRRGWASTNIGTIMTYGDRQVNKTTNDLSYFGWTISTDGWFVPIVVSQYSSGTNYEMFGNIFGYDVSPESDRTSFMYKDRIYYACWSNGGSYQNPAVVGGLHLTLTNNDYISACKTLIDACEAIDSDTLDGKHANEFLYANGFAGQLAKLFSQPANDDALATVFSVAPDDATLDTLNPGIYVVNTSAAHKSLKIPNEIVMGGPNGATPDNSQCVGGILIKLGSILGKPGFYVTVAGGAVDRPYTTSCAFFISNKGSIYRAIESIHQSVDHTGPHMYASWAWKAFVFDSFSDNNIYSIQSIKYINTDITLAPGSYYTMYAVKGMYVLPYTSGTAYGPTKSFSLKPAGNSPDLCIVNTSSTKNLIIPAGRYLIHVK